MIRTLENAATSYSPKNKIKTQVYLLKASEIRDLNVHDWNLYCNKSAQCIEVLETHFTMFKMPNVVKLIEKFEEIMKSYNIKMF